MRIVSRFSWDLTIMIVGSAVSSVSFIAAILEGETLTSRIIKILCALLFWSGLAVEQIFMWKANKRRLKIESIVSGRRITGMSGIFSFLKTEFGFFTDATLAISLITYIVLVIGNWGENVAQYIFLFLIVLSFRLHCIANGKNYRYKLYLQKRRADDD
ncbi:MAG: hypothetical protein E7524_01155 [Ruminococcaceae bacterium]|nr:hypothetical protein [Oscillospiraceae bacterium]